MPGSRVKIPEGMTCHCSGELKINMIGEMPEDRSYYVSCTECGEEYPQMATADGAINFARAKIKGKKHE
jgi:hypothetical protein